MNTTGMSGILSRVTTTPGETRGRVTAAMLIIALALMATPSTRAAGNASTELDDTTLKYAESLSAAFQSVSSKVENSVVRIVSYGQRGQVSGSGFVIRSDGYLLTNNHVVEDATRIQVEFVNGRTYQASLVGRDPLTDLGVIRLDAGRDLPAMTMVASDNLKVGEWVIAIGFPLGLAQTVTAGIISATNRQLGIIGDYTRPGYEDFIQTDAAINKGNSGGPLVNLRGEVVGVNSVIVTRTGGSDGLGFAIPANLARHIADQLIAYNRVRRGYLGVDIQDVNRALARSYGLPDGELGVLIKHAEPSLPGGKAGLQYEDIIVAVSGESVRDSSDLRNKVAMRLPGTEVTLDVYRDGKLLQLTTELAEMPDSGSVSGLPADAEISVRNELDGTAGGMTYQNVRDRSAVLVEQVLPGGPADQAGLEGVSYRFGQPSAYDLIVEVDGEPMAELASKNDMTPADWLAQRLKDAKPGEVLRFNVERRNASSRTMSSFLTAIEVQ
ncbi:MAG: PDZ domain-containing protein [Planctomycetes bacterium]|nr:PDZ domain-containing protein [Planctomycetota bacterium]